MDDVDRIVEVMDAAFDPAHGEAWTRRQLSDALTSAGTHYLLIGLDGGLLEGDAPAAGFALSRAVLDEEELLLLAVVPQYRRRGLGARLLRQFIDDARSRGMRRLFLEMRDGNVAEALYRRHGFTSIARRRHYYRRGSHGPRDAITFALAIGGVQS
jgi:ribosomal-protein-alanine N-acetyltransferase